MGDDGIMKKNRKGFTLAELLIVVAIIGVLVAVSIPIFSDQLLKAKIATDNANMRAAKAAAVAAYLDGDKANSGRPESMNSYWYGSKPSDLDSSYTLYWYDAAKGIVYRDTGANRSSILAIEPYGKTPTLYSKTAGTEMWAHKDRVVCVAIGNNDGSVYVGWPDNRGFQQNSDINNYYIQWFTEPMNASDLKKSRR